MSDIDYEERRLLALRRYGLLDSPPEAIFDGITVAIANICNVPIALVSLVDFDRQWFKSSYGLSVRQTPRDIAFCDRAITEPDEMLVVEDAAVDPRFQDNPLVTQDPRIRFYAGKPLVTGDGYPIGTLCVIDRKPRQLLPFQRAALDALSATVSAILDERHRLQKVAIDRDDMETLLAENADRYQHLYEDAETMLRGVLQRLPSASVVINKQGTIVSCNDAWTQYSEAMGWAHSALGGNYLNACVDDSAPFGDNSSQALSGVCGVLKGEVDHFYLKYSTQSGDCSLEAEPVAERRSGAIVQHFVSDAWPESAST